VVGELLASWQVGGARAGWRPFLHHISKNSAQTTRVIALKAPKKPPRVVTPDEVKAILNGCGTSCCSLCSLPPAYSRGLSRV
jgi:integrase